MQFFTLMLEFLTNVFSSVFANLHVQINTLKKISKTCLPLFALFARKCKIKNNIVVNKV